MSTALIIALGAVAVILFAVFIARRGANTKTQSRDDGSGSYVASDTGSSDCSVSDSGGCDGGGGGGD
jgi:hypothetical protein